MFSKYLKTLSILKKFLFINFVIFTIIGLFTLIYLKNIEPSLLKKKSEDHRNIINNTTDNIGALLFGNNIDKSVVKIQGTTHTANNTGDIQFHTSTTGTMSEKLRIKNTKKCKR